MYHDLPFAARFWSFLFAIDQDLANTIRKNKHVRAAVASTPPTMPGRGARQLLPVPAGGRNRQ